MTAAPDTQPAAEEAPPERPVEDRLPAVRATMDLTIRSDQDNLTDAQWAALQSVVNVPNIKQDTAAHPHLRAFLHVCTNRGLDPLAREAHLIARGQGDKRKFTMQVGIDGYRKMAYATGRMIRRVGWFWTGPDNDPASWVTVDVPGVGPVERRRWFDYWPDSQGHPGAAKCVIEHYDTTGNVVTTDAIAHWAMYAPFEDEVEWVDGASGRREKRTLRNPDGTPKKRLTAKWKDGPAHMLAKCAESAAIRAAFPREVSGFYTHEEMHAADVAEKQRLAAAQAAARQEAFARAHAPKPAVEPPAAPRQRVVQGEAVQPQPEPQDAPGEESAPLLDVGDAVEPEPVEEPPEDVQDDEQAPDGGGPGSDEEARRLLLLEFAFQGDALGATLQRVAARPLKAAGVDSVEKLPTDALLALVVSVRAAVARKVEENGDPESAAAYRAAPPVAAPMAVLLGG